MDCPKCSRYYHEMKRFCPHCGEANPSAKQAGAEPVSAGPPEAGNTRIDDLRRERAIYLWLAVIPYLIGLALLFSLRNVIAADIVGLALLLILFATIRAARKLELSRGETTIAIVLVLLVYIGSFFYVLRKFSDAEARLKGEPFDAAASRRKTVLMTGLGVILGLGLGALIFFAFNAGKKTTTVTINTDESEKAQPVAKGGWTSGRLDSMHGTDARHVWVVGEAGFIGFFDGSSWKQQADMGGEWLNSVYAISNTNVWAVGDNGNVFHYDGKRWGRKVTNLYKNLRGVSAADVNHVWAVGDSGTILFFNGQAWSAQESGNPNGLRAVVAVDPVHVWAVGTGGTVLFYDGTKWSLEDAGASGDLLGAAAADAGHVWTTGTEGAIHFFDGTSWKPQGDLHEWLNVLCAVDSTHAWAFGSFGKIASFDGSNWAAQGSSDSKSYYGAFGTDARNVRACGDAGTIIRFDGKSWKVEKGE